MGSRAPNVKRPVQSVDSPNDRSSTPPRARDVEVRGGEVAGEAHLGRRGWTRKRRRRRTATDRARTPNGVSGVDEPSAVRLERREAERLVVIPYVGREPHPGRRRTLDLGELTTRVGRVPVENERGAKLVARFVKSPLQ